MQDVGPSVAAFGVILTCLPLMVRNQDCRVGTILAGFGFLLLLVGVSGVLREIQSELFSFLNPISFVAMVILVTTALVRKYRSQSAESERREQ